MGLFHKPVNTKLWKPIVLSHYIQKVLCTQKKAVLSLLYYWSMKYEFKPSRRCETWGGHCLQTGVGSRKSLTWVETFYLNLQSNLEHWNVHTLDWSRQWLLADIRHFFWLKKIKVKLDPPGSSFVFPRFPWLLVTVLLTVSNVMQLVTPYRGSG